MQLRRLTVGDVQKNRLMMPSCHEGQRQAARRAQAGAGLPRAGGAAQASRERPDRPTPPLLLKDDGEPWAKTNHRDPVRDAVRRAGLDPDKITIYALRHSSIVRQLLKGIPIRVVADRARHQRRDDRKNIQQTHPAITPTRWCGRRCSISLCRPRATSCRCGDAPCSSIRKHGFDAEAVAAIESTLPPGANPDAVFIDLEDAAVAYLRHSDPAMDRDRIARGIALIDKAHAWLRVERRHPSVADDGGATRRAIEALRELKLQLESALADRRAKVRASKGTADPDQEQLYGAILRAWVNAGGKLRVSTRDGGALGSFFTTVMLAITGDALTIDGLKKIVRRWRPVLEAKPKKKRGTQKPKKRGTPKPKKKRDTPKPKKSALE